MADNKEYEAVLLADKGIHQNGKSEKDSLLTPSTNRYSSEWELLNIFKSQMRLHAKTSVMRSYTSEDEEKFTAQVKQCAVNKTDLDIYQVLSFESTLYDPLDIKQVWNYRIKSFKAIICSLTQIVAIIIILYQLIQNAATGDKYACLNVHNIHHEWYMNILAFLVSMHFSFSVLQKLSLTKGLYRYIVLIDYNVKWIDHGWLYYGCLINTIVSVLSVWGGFFIVFFAESALSMIFSVVSIWYLAGLDDAMVQTNDYIALQKAIESDFKGRDKGLARWRSRKCGKGKCCNLCEKMVYIVVGIPWITVEYITIAAAFLMPFYFVVCF